MWHPGQHLVATGGVGVVIGRHGPQDRDLIREFGGERHQFAHTQSGGCRVDRAKFSPDLGGCVWLGVPGFVLGRSADQAKHNHRPGLAGARECAQFRSPAKPGHGESTQRNAANPQPFAPGNAVA